MCITDVVKDKQKIEVKRENMNKPNEKYKSKCFLDTNP